MNLGPYERNCRAHWVGHNDPMPDDFSFQLFPDDLERLEHYLDDAVRARADAGQGRPVQGDQRADPLRARRQPADRPDARRAQRLRGLRLHLRHRPGRRRRQGAGRMGDRKARPNGTCGPATRAASPRFASAPDYCVAKGMEIYGNEYAISFPRHAWPAGRDRKLSPIHDRIAALGAQFNAYNGWERATWYAKPGDDISEAGDADLPPRRPVAAAHPRGVPGGARRRRHPRPARLLALPPARRRRARLAVVADHRRGAETRPHRPRLFRRR